MSSEAVADWGDGADAQGQLEEQRAADAPAVQETATQEVSMEERPAAEVQRLEEPAEEQEGKKEQTKPWNDILDLTLDDYIRQHRPSLLLVRGLRRGDTEPRYSGRRGQRSGGASAERDWRAADGREQGRREGDQEEENQTKRRRWTTEEAMEKLEGGTAKDQSISRACGSDSRGAASGSESSTSLPGARPGMAPSVTGAHICASTLGTPAHTQLGRYTRGPTAARCTPTQGSGSGR